MHGSEKAVYAPVVLSDALAEQVKDLLNASADAAHAIRQSAQVDADVIRRKAARKAAKNGHAVEAPADDRVPELEATVAELRELVADLRTDVDRLTTELTLVGHEPRALPPPPDAEPASNGFDRRALLIALNMASNGASRAEAAHYLADSLDIHDCGELLDAVYGYVDSSAA